MSNWKFLEESRVTKPTNGVLPQYISDSSFGFNGLFRFWWKNKKLRAVASDGEGWQHVSVSIEGDMRCPTWEAMCFVKDLFWEDEDVVVQYHPAKSQYVNNHPGCLHLWRPTAEILPTPKAYMVGIK